MEGTLLEGIGDPQMTKTSPLPSEFFFFFEKERYVSTCGEIAQYKTTELRIASLRLLETTRGVVRTGCLEEAACFFF